MLLTQKAIAEGARALIYMTAQKADIVQSGKTEEERKAADELLGFLTPIAKAFLTEIDTNQPAWECRYSVATAMFPSGAWSRTCVTPVSA